MTPPLPPDPERNTSEQAVNQIQLGDRKGDNDKLEDCLEKVAKRLNKGGSGSFELVELVKLFAGWASLGFTAAKKLWPACKRGIKKFTDAENRKIRTKAAAKRTEAEARKIDAEAEKIKAEALKVEAEAAKARVEALREEYRLRVEMLRERGIDSRAEVIEGRLHIVVVKRTDPPGLPPPADDAGAYER